jgi:hypothetical protein
MVMIQDIFAEHQQYGYGHMGIGVSTLYSFVAVQSGSVGSVEEASVFLEVIFGVPEDDFD